MRTSNTILSDRIGRPLLLISVFALLLAGPSIVLAASNTATGDVAGDPDDLIDSDPFILNATTLALVKTAFLTDGTQLLSGASVPSGTLVQFMIYVDNEASIQVDDLNIEDDLDAAFVYQDDTLKIDASQGTGTAEDLIYDAVEATDPIDDDVELGDVAGVNGTLVSAGSGTSNAPLDVPARTVFAMLFTVEVQ